MYTLSKTRYRIWTPRKREIEIEKGSGRLESSASGNNPLRGRKAREEEEALSVGRSAIA